MKSSKKPLLILTGLAALACTEPQQKLSDTSLADTLIPKLVLRQQDYCHTCVWLGGYNDQSFRESLEQEFVEDTRGCSSYLEFLYARIRDGNCIETYY